MKAITVNEWVRLDPSPRHSATGHHDNVGQHWMWANGSGSLQPDMPELGLVLPFCLCQMVKCTYHFQPSSSKPAALQLQSSCQRPCLPISTCTVVLAFSFFLFLFNSAAAGPATQSALRNLAKNLCICLSLKEVAVAMAAMAEVQDKVLSVPGFYSPSIHCSIAAAILYWRPASEWEAKVVLSRVIAVHC